MRYSRTLGHHWRRTGLRRASVPLGKSSCRRSVASLPFRHPCRLMRLHPQYLRMRLHPQHLRIRLRRRKVRRGSHPLQHHALLRVPRAARVRTSALDTSSCAVSAARSGAS